MTILALLLILCEPARDNKATLTCTLQVSSDWDTVVGYLAGHEKVLVASSRVAIVSDDSSQDFTCGEPRDVEINSPKGVLRLTVVATEELGGPGHDKQEATWSIRMTKPGTSRLRSYGIDASCVAGPDTKTTIIKITTYASSAQWRFGELAAGLSKTIRGAENAIGKKFPTRRTQPDQVK